MSGFVEKFHPVTRADSSAPSRPRQARRTRGLRRLGVALLVCVAGLAGSGTSTVRAQDYPNKPVQLVVPTGAGGINDIISRQIAQRLSKNWGQPVIVINKPGAGGIIGSQMVATAAPDGYTILMVYSSHQVNPSLYSKLPYDTLRDFEPITLVNTVDLVLTVGASTRANSLRELIAMAKAQPGKLNYGTVGTGSLGHLAGIRFAKAAGINIVQLPYKSAPEVNTALLSGDATMFFDSPITALPFIKDGRTKALGVTSAARSPALPNVPTIAEAGIPGFEVIGWNGLLAPAGTPKPIINKLNAEIVRILRSPEVTQSLKAQGVDVVGNSPEQFGAIIVKDVAKWAEIIKEARIRLD